MRTATLHVCLLIALCFCRPLAANADVQSVIRERVENVLAGECGGIADCPISSAVILPALYEKYGYRPIWSNEQSVRQLITAIEESDLDGLDPHDYHLDGIRTLQARLASDNSPRNRAELDLVLTDSLIRLGYHLLIGKVDPQSLDGNWNMQRSLELDPVLKLSSAIDRGEVGNLVDSMRPQARIYHALKQALAEYRGIQAAGGWPDVPTGKTLKPGMSDPRVPVMRKRLVLTGDMPATNPESVDYDAELAAGVRNFQQRHGLEVDGVVGQGTLAAMNIPVEARIEQLRVNLERARWVLHDLPEEFVLTDIAGFRVRYYRAGQPVWQTRAQVGMAYRKTPVFRDRIRYIEFNPTWTVPPTILKKDILPKVAGDTGYLERKNLRVLDRDGTEIDPATIDWTIYPAAGFPYLLRQDPGPDNALGRVKFMFPNKHAVYLHDTPYQAKFERAQRAFSSGCIRIEHPFEFAGLLLDDQPDWDRARIDRVIESRKTTRVNLTEPLVVLLLYWTAEVDDSGRVIFRDDIYKRDPDILAALNDKFRFRSGPVITRQ